MMKQGVLFAVVALFGGIALRAQEPYLKYENIHLAVEKGDLADLKNHLQRGAAINATNRNGETLLFTAVRYSQVEIAEFLLANGADVNMTNAGNATPLHVAIVANNLELVDALLAKGAALEYVSLPPPRGEPAMAGTPFHVAARMANLAAIEKLVAKGANKDARDSEGRTVLETAMIGARWNSRWAAVEEALAARRQAARYLLANGTKIPSSLVLKAVTTGDTELVRLLLSYGADPNTRCKNGYTAIHWAIISKQSPGMLSTLTDGGADPRARAIENGGATSLHLAARFSTPEVVKWLLSSGADINAEVEKNVGKRETPLDWANEFTKAELQRNGARHGPPQQGLPTVTVITYQNEPVSPENETMIAPLAEPKVFSEEPAPQESNLALEAALQSQLPDPLNSWGLLVLRQAKENWTLPDRLRFTGEGGVVVVSFSVARDGRLSGAPAVIEGFENPDLVQAVVAAIVHGEPYAPLPNTFNAREQSIVCRFTLE